MPSSIAQHRVGVGVIGAGFGGNVQVPALLALPEAHVIGITARNQTRAAEVAHKHGIRHFASWQELIADPTVQLVSIATPPTMHKEIASAAIAAGKAILCEKPFTLGSGEADGLLEAADKAEVVHAVDFEFRELPAWRALKRKLDAGEAGDLRHIDIRWTVGSWADPNRTWSWIQDATQGGGIVGALGVHAFDYIEWFFGPIRSVSATCNIAITMRPDEKGKLKPVTSEDNAHLLLELDGGVPVTFTLSNAAPRGAGHFLDIHGSKKSFFLGSDALTDYGKGFLLREGIPESTALRTCTLTDNEQAEANTIEDAVDGRIFPFQQLASRIIAGIKGTEPYIGPTFANGWRSQMIREAALKASKEGKRVELS